MSVQSEMDRIKSNIQNTYSVLSDLGADVPSEPKSNNLAESAKTVSAVLFKSQDLTSEQKQQARANIEAAKQANVDNLSKEIDDLKENGSGATKEQIQQIEKNKQDISAINNRLETGNFNGLSAYQVACNNGFVGTETEWIASLHAANPEILSMLQYPTEAEAIAYMNSQAGGGEVGACLYGYRNSASSGLKVESGKSLFIIPVSSFDVPLTIDFTGFAISSNPHVYGGTTPTAFPTSLIADDSWGGRTDPIEITNLQSCTYVAFAVTTASKPESAKVTVNGTEVTLNIITDTAEIESALTKNQGNTNKVYVWDNKLYVYTTRTVAQSCGAFLYNYRASGSSGIVVADARSLMVIPVSSFTLPLTIDYSPYAISQSAHIYGLTSLSAAPTSLIADDTWVGRTAPFDVSDLKGCAYVCFAVATSSKPASANVKVNDTEIPLTVITDKAELESAMSSSVGTVEGYADSGVIYTKIVGQNSCQQYLDDRNTYIAPVPSGYCESKVAYNTNGTHYLNKYNFTTMTGMFTALATANPDYVTETLLGKDSTNTYEIKSYVLDAPSAISSGYESAMGRDKPTFIITAGLHGVEPDAVHSVYHFMKDLCENYMESDHLEYLRNNVKFVIVPLSNPWGYVNQSYNNANDVDLNKNFAHGYRTNGTANTGANAYSEVETTLLKGVFDSYPKAIFHLECHGKYGEDTSIAQTIWFSLMRSLNSDLIEICAETITKQIGRRTYKLGHNANKSVGGYITYYGMNGRPKDYTGTEYGMLSCTMEGSGKLYGTTGYAIDTQKVNTEALENFILRVLDALNSRVEVF